MLAVIVCACSSFNAFTMPTRGIGASLPLVLRMSIDAPPVLPPTSVSSGKGGNGGGLMIETIDNTERRAILSLWLWQQDESLANTSAQVACQAPPFQRDSLTHVPAAVRSIAGG